MTKRIDGVLIIEAENPQQCDMCGEIAELRPYGPNSECICFPCAMKDEETTTKMFLKTMLPDDTHDIIFN